MKARCSSGIFGLTLAAVLLAVSRGGADEPISPPGRLRDPFRPIGYRPPSVRPPEPPAPVPTPVRSAASAETWEKARSMVQVQGFTSIGGRRMAIINDRVVSVGDKVELFYEGFLFRWVVDTLDEQGVTLRRLEETDGAAPGAESPPAAP